MPRPNQLTVFIAWKSLRETAQALHRVGALDKSTMRDIEAFCLTKVEAISGEEIQALREREGVSQAVLARTSTSDPNW